MTQTPDDSMPPAASQKSSVPVIFWILGGCGCLGAGLFIVVILAAIALPSFLNQTAKARGSEAKSNLGTLNRAQQTFLLEKGIFAKSIGDLDAKISGEFFEYQIIPSGNPKSAIATAMPIEFNLKSYTGFAFTVGSSPTTSQFISGICETDNISITPPAAPLAPASATEPVQCPPGSSLVE
jgi:type IV pilus assembly protein PilA